MSPLHQDGCLLHLELLLVLLWGLLQLAAAVGQGVAASHKAAGCRPAAAAGPA